MQQFEPISEQQSSRLEQSSKDPLQISENVPDKKISEMMPQVMIQGHKVSKSITTLETERYQIEDKIEQFQNKIVPLNDEVQVDMFSEINVETESKPISAPRASAMRYE